MRRRLFNRDERGISTVIVAISLLGIFGAAMLSLDAGNMWQTRRNIISVTDATALGQAKYLAFADDQSSCEFTWTNFMLNLEGAGAAVTPINCDPEAASNGTGYVVVEGRKEARTRIGSLFGIGNTEPYSLSAAQWGWISEARGLRPISFCNKNSHVEEWLGLKNGAGSWGPAVTPAQYQALAGTGDDNGDGRIDHPSYPAISTSYSNPPVVHRMYFNNDLDDGQCGNYPGNWGWLNFDGGAAANPDRNDWTENGYNEGTITIRPDSAGACPATPGNGDADDAHEGCVPADSGAIASANSDALDAIIGKKVHIMIFDNGTCANSSGGGVTCNFEAWAILGVVLRDFDATGPEANRWLDFEFTDIMLSGTCCVSEPVNGVDTGARGVKLCEVDHDFQAGSTIASRCVPTT